MKTIANSMAKKNLMQIALHNEGIAEGGKGCTKHQRLGQPIENVSDTILGGPYGRINDSCGNEIEIISDEELPNESTPEDGELSDIRLTYYL